MLHSWPAPSEADAPVAPRAPHGAAGGRYSRRFRRTDQLQVGGLVGLHACSLLVEMRCLVEFCSCQCQGTVTPSPQLTCPTHTPLPAYPCMQAVFDFVDVQSGVGGAIPPGSYSLATAYPRRVLQEGAAMSLQDAGLTARQEALFLELK